MSASIICFSAVTGRIAQGWWNKKSSENSFDEISEAAASDTLPLGSMETEESVNDEDTSSNQLPCLDERIDYELQEGFTERKLGYASFTSHTSYWKNQDLAFFVLTKLYGLDRLDQGVKV